MAFLRERSGPGGEQRPAMTPGRTAPAAWAPPGGPTGNAGFGAPLLPAVASTEAALPDAWLESTSADAVLSTPLRCRLGFHRWLPLAMSFSGARSSFDIAFCRCCPAVRRPARLGPPQ